MSFGGSYSASGGVYLSGLGCINGTSQKFTEAGHIVNRGEISYTGSSTHNDGKVRVGGLFASIPADVTTIVASETVDFVNLGNLTYSGTIANAANAAVGGIAAVTSSPITGAKAYFNADVVDGISSGFITGSARSTTVIASKCQIGGSFVGEYSVEEDEYSTIKLNSSNFYQSIYGSGKSTDWTGTDNYDGCSVLTTAPKVE